MKTKDDSIMNRIFEFLDTDRTRDFEYWVDIAGRWAAPTG